MKIEEIDAINYKNGKAKNAKEKVVKDETITLTINGTISRSLSAIEDSLKEFAVGYLLQSKKSMSTGHRSMLKLTIPYLKPMKPYSVPTLQEDGEAKSKP